MLERWEQLIAMVQAERTAAERLDDGEVEAVVNVTPLESAETDDGQVAAVGADPFAAS